MKEMSHHLNFSLKFLHLQKIFAKYFAPHNKHSNRVFGLKKTHP